MQREPKIAIYMSCYNHEKYVREAVDSILNQTYPNWELFVVNDGSTDNTGKILSSYNNEKIHYFDFKENTKFIGAANFLQELIRDLDFDYIATLASDDMWEEDKLEKQVNILLKHPEYKACFTWDKLIYSAGQGEYKSRTGYSHRENANRFDWIHFFFMNINCLNACSMLMDKNVFYEIGRMDENFIQLGDLRAWLLLLQKHPLYLIQEELTIYRRHDTNLSDPTSLVTCVRTYNELYHIWRELLLSMDKELFRRTFYRELVYVKCDSFEELLAEKFSILLHGINQSSVYRQVAMDIYYKYCDNKKFINILETRYMFSSHDFIALTGNSGLIYSINEWTEQEIIQSEKESVKVYLPGNILASAINNQLLNKDTLSDYRYSSLLNAYEITRNYEGGSLQFLSIKQVLNDLRTSIKRCEERKVLFLIAQNSAWDVKQCCKEFDLEEDLIYVGFVPQKEASFTETFENHDSNPFYNVNVYDETEHCLRFFDEFEDFDIIYYVDCLGSDYECEDMLAAPPLSVEYNCILHQGLYEKLQEEEAGSLAVMNQITTYVSSPSN